MPIQAAEVFSALIRTALSTSSETKLTGERERLRRAAHLLDAIVQRARDRGHGATDIARVLNMSAAHWYRIRNEPIRLAKLGLERLDALSSYIGWSRVQVMVAVGWLQQSEIDAVVSADGAIQQALQRLEHGGLANGLVTPLKHAATDHQVLMARLLLAAEAATTARRMKA
jgi:hypothetical protein